MRNISINQRIPLDVLEAALIAFLNEQYSQAYVMEQLMGAFEGSNRLKKAYDIVRKIIPQTPLISFLTENKGPVLLALKNKNDRNLILISLLNAAYPFSFDILRVFGKYFQVQEFVNTSLIEKTISAKYGSNRATSNGMYAVIPMFIEGGVFEREKVGLYAFHGALTISEIAKSCFAQSFQVNVKGIGGDVDFFDPYFVFLA